MSLLYPTWLKHLITEANNEIVDIKRVIGIGLAGQFSVQGLWATLINHQPFDPVGYGTGMAAVIAGIGAAIGLGRSGETPA